MNESTLVPREELSELDWLARNVHEWPTSTPHIVPPGDGVFEFGITFYKNHAFISRREYTHSKAVYKKQWLARRAKLQNKPSWDDAPSDMKWLAQDGDGQWYWYCSKPFVDETNDDKVWDFGDSFDHEDCEFGEVLGDWRDTLEKRPETRFKSMSGVHSDGDMIALHEELKDFDMNKFKPFTSIKDNQEKNMKQDNGWYERGELPPVGSSVTVVEVDGLGLSDLGREFIGEECKVMAAFTRPELSHSDAVDVVAVMEPRGGCCCFVLEMIRPIHTERDELVNVFINHYGNPKGAEGYIGIADAILAAGFSLEAK